MDREGRLRVRRRGRVLCDRRSQSRGRDSRSQSVLQRSADSRRRREGPSRSRRERGHLRSERSRSPQRSDRPRSRDRDRSRRRSSLHSSERDRRSRRRSQSCVRARKSRSVRTPSIPRSHFESLSSIAARLDALEDRSRVNEPSEQSTGRATEQIVEAIHSLRSVSAHNYFISSFDPNLHDVEAWFNEVDRAKLANRWDDYECMSRVGNCLKGDAKVWLNEWVSNDRSWTNFKSDFRPLCAKKVDVANILFEVMSTDSDSFRTYAEYARRSLLRLRIVRGLSDELISAIIIRGIRDPHVKASATNANLGSNDVVGFLSTFVKPAKDLVTDARTQRNTTYRSESLKASGFRRPGVSNNDDAYQYQSRVDDDGIEPGPSTRPDPPIEGAEDDSGLIQINPDPDEDVRVSGEAVLAVSGSVGGNCDDSHI